MKVITFRIFGRTFTFHFGKKKNVALEEPKEVSNEEVLMKERQHVQELKAQGYSTAIIAGEEVVGPVTPCFYGSCVDYIESQRGKLADSTLRGYLNIANNHLEYLMEFHTLSIDDNVIQKAFDAEIAKGLGEKTLKGYRSFVLKVLAECRPDLKPEIRIRMPEVQQ